MKTTRRSKNSKWQYCNVFHYLLQNKCQFFMLCDDFGWLVKIKLNSWNDIRRKFFKYAKNRYFIYDNVISWNFVSFILPISHQFFCNSIVCYMKFYTFLSPPIESKAVHCEYVPITISLVFMLDCDEQTYFLDGFMVPDPMHDKNELEVTATLLIFMSHQDWHAFIHTSKPRIYTSWNALHICTYSSMLSPTVNHNFK